MTNTNRSSSEVTDSYMGSDIPSTAPRHSVHLIPSPGSQGKPLKPYEPFIMKFGLAIGVPLLMLALGIGLEIAIKLSNLADGFQVPKGNVLGDFSPQLLASFFPTLLILPVAIAWRDIDWILRWYQPYIILDKGNVNAEESLLLDYIALGPLLALLPALNYKHHVIFWSSLIALLTYIYQPFVGSILQIQQRPRTSHISVTSTKSIGLSSDIFDLGAFVAAAGYVDSSVLLDISDPPFINNGWVTATFEYPPDQWLNGFLTINTSAIQTNVNCFNPFEPPVLTPVGTTNFSLSSKSVDGCVHSVLFDFTVDVHQYGVDDVTCPGDSLSLDSSLRPVMFWFFHIQDDNKTPEAKTIFCKPTIQAYEVQAVANMNNGSFSTVTSTGNYLSQNNVTGAGGALNGNAFNGLIFDNITNPLISARAATIRSIIPEAIFLSAQQLPNGLQSAFDTNNFLDLTTTLYTRHLSVSAQFIYFVNANTTLPATVVSLLPSLKVVPLPAHILAIVLILTGIIGIIIQVISQPRRKRLLLAAPLGSIASTMALTARSGFGELLLPYDDALTIEKKLGGLRFRLDKRTGAIIADEVEGGRPQAMVSDDITMGLLGNRSLPKSPTSMSSSDLARAVAAGAFGREGI